MGLEEKIAEIEKEISRTQKNKATEKHLGLLKSRLIKYKLEFQAAGGQLQEKKVSTAPKGKTGKNMGKKGAVSVPVAKPERVHRKQNEGSSSSEVESEIEESSDGSENELAAVQRVNPFSLLEEDDKERENAALEVDSGDEADESADAGRSGSVEPREASKTPKKKKKKGARTAAVSGDGREHSTASKPLQSMTEDELIEMFAAQNLLSAGNAALDERGKKSSSWTVSTCVNAKLLNYRYEFQKTVGKSGMAAMVSDAAVSKASRGLVKGVQHLFVNQPPNSYDPKLIMDQFVELVKDPKRPNFLVFKRLKKYKELQRNFLMMVYSNQDQIIQDIIHQMPFHTDALLLMCSIYERDDNISSARQSIETALLGLQSCFDFQQRNHPELHRMSYRYPANRSYFVALFKHIVLTAPRFPGTALEMAKYLFNLNLKEDPLAVILMLDYLALRAKDYSYLIAFCQAFQDQKHLGMLPNFAYSMPLALFIRGTATSNEEDLEAARHLLEDALIRFPGVFRLLVEKLDVPRDLQSTTSAFSRLFGQDDNDGLGLLQALYVRRCTDFWKDQGVVAWLMERVSAAIDGHSRGELEKVATYADNRKRLYRGTPSNIWRHVLLLNIPYSEQVFQMHLPADAQSFIFPFDPIPPMNSEEKDEWDLRVHLAPPERRTTTPANPLGPAVQPIANGPPETVMQLVYNATGEFLRQLFPSTAVAAANAEMDPASVIGGEVVMGAAITDQDEEADELRECMDAVSTYLHAAEQEDE